jgi:capsular polysaccharide biosynthesis protein
MINVGKSDINTQATPGYVTAAESLASTYSRLVSSQHVTVPAARALRESPAVVSADLSAVPIPNEPTFTITATGSSPEGAVALANATIRALDRYVARSQTQGGGPSQLLAQYTAALSRADRLQQLSDRLQGRLSANLPGVTPAQVTQAKVDSQVAQLQAQALGNQYSSLISNGIAPTLDVLTTPSTPTTNRTSNIEKYAVVGAVAGLALGIALAGLVGSVEARRRKTPA